MEEEAREILRNAVSEDEVLPRGLCSEIAALFENSGLTSEIAELRGHGIRPISFKP
jgi:predicted esterase